MKRSNGLLPKEQLGHIQNGRIKGLKAELELTKCEAMPTKRQWWSAEEAVREAEARSVAAGMTIYAYECQSCKAYHLSKAFGPNVVTREDILPVERNWEALPVVPGNKDARMKLLRKWLEGGYEKPTTKEIVEEFDWHPTTVATYMTELGWSCSKGRTAHWSRKVEDEKPIAEVVPIVPEPKSATVTPLQVAKARAFADAEASRARHPAASVAGWLPFTGIDRVRHLAVGDLIDALAAAGIELRIQQRSSS